jgi:hypothetical protein
MTFHPILTHYMYIILNIGGKSYFNGGKKLLYRLLDIIIIHVKGK